MAQTSETFVKGRMNKSVDERLVPPGEYVDALNVRLGSTETTEIGAVENSKGNSRLSTLEYAGQPLTTNARTIGYFEDGINETIYWFVHDENNPNSASTGVVDMIVSFNTTTNVLVYHVISTQVLNFNFQYLITGVSKIENLLFFTDDLNPPRMINVTRSYAEPFGNLDTVLEEEDISVIVKPPGFEDFDAAAGEVSPLGTPHVELINLPGEENYMETRFLSFAYRYRYEDGQYSATSLFSNPAFEPDEFVISIQNFWNEGMQNHYNGCKVTFSTGSKRVKEIQLLYKEATSNVIYIIKRYNKEDLFLGSNSFYTVTFSNSEIYTTLGSDELLRLYDNVPRVAKAQTIQGNRLIFGNYVDGYDIRLNSKDGPLISVDYNVQPITTPIAGTELGLYSGNSLNPSLSTGNYTLTGVATTQPNGKLTWDLSAVTGIIEAETVFFFSFQLERFDQVSGAVFPSFTIEMKFVASVQYVNIAALLESQEFKNLIGGSALQGFTDISGIVQPLYPCNKSSEGGTLSDKFYLAGEEELEATYGQRFLIGGGVDAGLCDQSVTLLGTPLFPLPCNATPIYSGISTTYTGSIFVNDNVVQDNNASTFGPLCFNSPVTGAAIWTTLTNVPFEVYTVTNLTTGESTFVAGLDYEPASSYPCANVLVLNDNIGLSTGGIQYEISIGGNFGENECLPDGFKYEHTTGSSSFSLTAPAINFADENSNTAIGYYSFKQFGCRASFKKDSSSLSLHSNRDYEVGVVYMDEYGRASTVLTSINNNVYFPPNTSVYKNEIKVTLDNFPPYWAKKYKFVVKPSQGEYNTIFSYVFYKQDGTGKDSVPTGLALTTANDPSLVWFKLDGQNASIVSVGDELLVKQDAQGPVLTEAKSVVLAVQAFSGGGIQSSDSSDTPGDNSLAGLYMLLKPDGWTANVLNVKNYYYGQYTRKKKKQFEPDLCILDYPLYDAAAGGINYTIPAGSIITIKFTVWRGGTKCYGRLNYSKTFVASDNYEDFRAFAIGDNLSSQITHNDSGCFTEGGSNLPNGLTLSFNPSYGNSPAYPNTFCNMQTENTTVRTGIWKDDAGVLRFLCNSDLQDCTEVFSGDTGKFPSHMDLEIEVTRNAGKFVFETAPAEVDPNLFYDASNLLDIEGGFHMAKQNFNPNTNTYSLADLSIDQTATQPLVTVLDAYNCYTFANGVESYRIYDSPSGKAFRLGERTLAVSNQDFKEADRFAGMTYSGVYSSSANVNNLNEFNLGLVNFKDCEVEFGPIQILHARQTDILTLQEDRITYVLSKKNLISDAVGGGAIVSTPEILGNQIARIEEYGISFNPESFVSWGSDMFFTDGKRNAVINLKGTSSSNDQLQVISKMGMNSWFRDTFTAQLTTQKLGGYDPYMQEYVLGTNLNTVKQVEDIVPCDQTISQIAQTTVLNYEVELGQYIGSVTIPYHVSSGNVDISVTWNGNTVSVAGATIPGSLTFNKTLTSPTKCTVSITPNVASTYNIKVECIQQVKISVVGVVLNSDNYVGETIHLNYNWNNGPGAVGQVTTSPFESLSFNPIVLQASQPAGYQIITGTRGVGVFPYDGVNVTMRAQEILPDTFDFDPLLHRFRILSSNTFYNPTSASDIASLVTASSLVTPIGEAPTGTYSATETAMSIPIGNQYLYLIWDLRQITPQQVCYCPTTDTLIDVCCNCVQVCKPTFMGPKCSSFAQACTTDVDSPGHVVGANFFGNAGIPSVGDVVCEKCDPNQPIVAGFYIVSSVTPSPVNVPKNWVQLDVTGTVIAAGTC